MARKKMGFPILIGAHDHDPYLELIEGCYVVKTGADAVNAAVCMYVCMYSCMYVCMYVCVGVHRGMLYGQNRGGIYECGSLHSCMYVCMYECMHVCMYVF